jgi:hypothetical protein
MGDKDETSSSNSDLSPEAQREFNYRRGYRDGFRSGYWAMDGLMAANKMSRRSSL